MDGFGEEVSYIFANHYPVYADYVKTLHRATLAVESEMDLSREVNLVKV